MQARFRRICRDSQRQGLTLLEVLLSLGLFLGALAALSQLWYGGVRAAVQRDYRRRRSCDANRS